MPFQSTFYMYMYCRRKTSVYREKKYPYDCFMVSHSVIMTDFIMPKTQQPIIVIILIIYSLYLSKNLVEL